MALLAGALVGAIGALAARELAGRLLLQRSSRPKQLTVDHTGSDVAESSSFQPARRVSPPHKNWQPGSPQPCPLPEADTFIDIDPATYDKPSLYALVISAVVPRPVAFISSISDQGVNLSPYSYFNAVGHNPPTVAIGLCHTPSRPDGKKDSLYNIEHTGEFVVNIMSDWFVEAANHTCGDYPRGVDEFKVAGLSPLPSTKVQAPRVAESAVQMECVVRHIHRVEDESGKVTTSVVIGQVVAYHVSKAVTGRSPTGKLVVDPVKLAPVCRLGGITYGRVTELYDLQRPNSKGEYPQPPPPQQGQQQGQGQPQGAAA